ncbi:carbohydrate ABC transporter permease [Cellulomonas carbonis]|uniref:ABC transporter permease n=1 Tax=Cellulomonas carbonis T26 TaxID=947969 RepID=A0A0A0BUE8_9CELL|nr:sugar ABC transporter permease [Cellulomonas carbonis]KGM11297.1 ABC transporter permease [Cellulomonas carbonis T26]GGC00945.1 ABC transporter permease [Cellulomonas carbonis]
MGITTGPPAGPASGVRQALRRGRAGSRVGTRAARTAPRVGPDGRRRRRVELTPYLFLLVPVGLLVTFTYVPVMNMVGYSFTDWNGISKDRDVVGLANYARIFGGPEYFEVFFVSLYYFAASFVQMGLALYFATVLSFSTRFRNLFKGILFFPYLINGVAIGFTFLYFFRPGGTLDTTLAALGLEALTTQWLGNPDVINVSLAGTSVWRYTGLNFVLFLGAIQSINPHLYEAAELDGANRWDQFRWIILPSIKPVVTLSFILAVSGSLAVFEIPYVMTGGANGSETFVIQTIGLAFEMRPRRVGLASAMAVVLLLFVLLITWIQRKVVPDEKVNLT